MWSYIIFRWAGNVGKQIAQMLVEDLDNPFTD